MPNSRALSRLLFAAALLAVAPPLSAQTPGSIRGIATDALTGAPVAEVQITVSGSDVSAVTDAQGAYFIAEVPPGLVKVSAQIIGYVPITTPYYSIKPDATTEVDFRLAPLSIELDPVEVVGERYERAEYHMGAQVIRADQLPARGDILNALDQVVAGLDTRGRRLARIRARGSRHEVLFVIDGVTITPPLTFYIDAADVECVEVRRGYHAAAEFRRGLDSEPYSGVILIWTKGSHAPMPRRCLRRDGS